MSQYVHERWGTEQGFPRGPVYAIAQSSDGYLWIGTRAGLVRFDGLNFRLVRDAPELLNNDNVLGLTPDRREATLAATEPVTGVRVGLDVAPRTRQHPVPATAYNGPGRFERQDRRAPGFTRPRIRASAWHCTTTVSAP